MQRLSHPAFFNEEVTQGAFSGNTHTHAHAHKDKCCLYNYADTSKLVPLESRQERAPERGEREVVTVDANSVWLEGQSCFWAVSSCQGDQAAQVQYPDSHYLKGTNPVSSQLSKGTQTERKARGRGVAIRLPLQPGCTKVVQL